MKKRIIYLSGPMKGKPERNYPLFNDVTKQLRDAGHRVYNPAEFPHDYNSGPFPLRQAFAVYCVFIALEADTIVMLPDWENSAGARTERELARMCGVEIIEWENWSENTEI